MKYFLNTVFALFMLVTINTLYAQETKQDKSAKKDSTVRMLVESQNYIFQAQSAMPMSGGNRQLDYGFRLRVGKDTVDSYLPYFGRAYVAPMDPSKNDLEFISTDFQYTAEPDKKSGWQITIKPKDIKAVEEMNLSISSNAYATLQVTFNNKQPISFYGTITEKKKKK